jgi:hypothetical protein
MYRATSHTETETTTQDSITIDAFNLNLHNCRILCQGVFRKFPPLLDSVSNIRDPFKKHVLLTRTMYSLISYLPMTYDATFQVHDLIDWQMFLTYINYAPKPALVIAENVEIPHIIWTKMAKDITFIHFSHAPVRNPNIYDCIFWPPMEHIDSQISNTIAKELQQHYGISYAQKDLHEILNELRVAQAGMAIAKHIRIQSLNPSNGNHTNQYNLYWYDPVDKKNCVKGQALTNQQLSELLTWISVQLREES